jgi:hypothetical protein
MFTAFVREAPGSSLVIDKAYYERLFESSRQDNDEITCAYRHAVEQRLHTTCAPATKQRTFSYPHVCEPSRSTHKENPFADW